MVRSLSFQSFVFYSSLLVSPLVAFLRGAPLPNPVGVINGGLSHPTSIQRSYSSVSQVCPLPLLAVPAKYKDDDEPELKLNFTSSFNNSDASSTTLSRKERKAEERLSDYEYRRALWEARYGSVEALRQRFGKSNLWGDLDPESTRQLYHTLLPRSLLGLHEAGLMRPDELAPLAYKARVAAKEYARERCTMPGRILAMAFDGYRSYRRDGTFDTKGMSWEQLWDKYEAQIVEEECVHELEERQIDEDALTNRIYLRILERSCATNQAFDQVFLKSSNGVGEHWNDELGDPTAIASKLENDVWEILLHPQGAKKAMKNAQKAEKKRQKIEKKLKKIEYKAEKTANKEERREERKARKAEKKRAKAELKLARKQQLKEREEEVTKDMNKTEKADRRRHAYNVLRIIARTRRRFSRG